MDELVSIVVPIYNVEKYVRQCVESIIAQSYRNIEVIVIDDGSTDDSACCVQKIKDSRIKVFRQKNRGLSAARNAGISKCNGDYIAFIDGDDIISSVFIETMLDEMKKADADLVCCESLNFLESQTKNVLKVLDQSSNKCFERELLSSKEALIRMFYQKPSITATYLKLYKRNAFEKICFPEGRYFEDSATTYKLIMNARNVVIIHKKLYAYRIRSNGIMGEHFSKRKMDCVWIAHSYDKEFEHSEENIKKAANCAAFRINRIVYEQIPMFETRYKNIIWNEILSRRSSVLENEDAKLYERLLALTSFTGELGFKLALKLFTVIKKLKIVFEMGAAII